MITIGDWRSHVRVSGERFHATGTPEDVLTEECVRAVFGLDSKVIVDTTSGKPLMLPMGRHHTAPRADVLQGTPGS